MGAKPWLEAEDSMSSHTFLIVRTNCPRSVLVLLNIDVRPRLATWQGAARSLAVSEDET